MVIRTSFYASFIVAPLAWTILLLFTRFVPPDSIIAFIAFFCVLAIAVTFTVAPIAYFVEVRLFPKLQPQALQYHALRQGFLLAVVLILNLFFRALHSWNIFMFIVSLGAAFMIELLSMARK